MQHSKSFQPILITLFILITFSSFSMAVIDPTKAAEYFQEASAACHKDNGALWGKSLCVPMLIIDRDTRQCVANQPDAQGQLTEQDGVYVGQWPDNLPIANSTETWNGKIWSTLVWPLTEDKTARVALLMHESFHNIEESLGFSKKIISNPQLGKRDGRIWLRLEWAAMRKGLLETGDKQLQAFRDALAFRAYRRSLYAGSAESERKLEMHEGLAEYTGIRLSGLQLKDAIPYLVNISYALRLKDPSFENSFAYFSGPVYGFALDILGIDWRRSLRATDDLGKLLQTAIGYKIPSDIKATAETRSKDYNGVAVIYEEMEREHKQKQRLDNYRKTLVDGPVLVIPLQQMKLQFDNRNIVTLDDKGSVYPNIRISDMWGILTVTDGGALMAPTWNQITVPAPVITSGSSIQGQGWKLELAKGWSINEGARKGDYTLTFGKTN